MRGAFGSPKHFDSIIAVTALVAVCALRLVRWKDIDATTNWGVLLLFGGGLTLSSILGSTGASAYLADQLHGMTVGWPLIFLVGALVLFVIFLTELSSNTATTALFAPIFIEVAAKLGVDPATLSYQVPIRTQWSPPNSARMTRSSYPEAATGHPQIRHQDHWHRRLLASDPAPDRVTEARTHSVGTQSHEQRNPSGQRQNRLPIGSGMTLHSDI